MTKPRRNVTDAFKREAVALLEASGRPLMQIANELGIAASMLRNWHDGAGMPTGASSLPTKQAMPPSAGGPEERSAAAASSGWKRLHGIRAAKGRQFRVATTDSNHAVAVADNLLGQTFSATRSNQVWLADITAIPTDEGWLYLAVVLERFSRKVAGWAMRDQVAQELTIAALTMAIQRQRPGRGLIHHSDRGSQYAAGDDYRDLLKATDSSLNWRSLRGQIGCRSLARWPRARSSTNIWR